mmetsp:Transcript_12744/g.12549  ORF Transcript_12744/g.12549 Transcript_12744/m.12549 type:complete len:92 (+) Transcript_12744:210-485(+)
MVSILRVSFTITYEGRTDSDPKSMTDIAIAHNRLYSVSRIHTSCLRYSSMNILFLWGMWMGKVIMIPIVMEEGGLSAHKNNHQKRIHRQIE